MPVTEVAVQPVRRFKVRGGDHAFTQIPNEILRDPSLSPKAKVLYALILDIVAFWDEEPTQEHLGEMLGVTAKTAREAIYELEQAGWLVVDRSRTAEPLGYELLLPECRPGRNDRQPTVETSVSPRARSLWEDDELQDEDKVKTGDLALVETTAPVKADPALVVYEHWRIQRHRTDRRYDKPLPARLEKIRTRLKTYSPEELMRAIDGVALDPWEERDRNDDIGLIFRNDEHVERFLRYAEAPPNKRFVTAQDLAHNAVRLAREGR